MSELVTAYIFLTAIIYLLVILFFHFIKKLRNQKKMRLAVLIVIGYPVFFAGGHGFALLPLGLGVLALDHIYFELTQPTLIISSIYLSVVGGMFSLAYFTRARFKKK